MDSKLSLHEEIIVQILSPYDQDVLWHLNSQSHDDRTIIQTWLKSVGDSVEKNEPLILIRSSKNSATNVALHAPESGILDQQYHQAGESVLAMRKLGIIKTTRDLITKNINTVCEHPVYDVAISLVRKNTGHGILKSLINMSLNNKEWVENLKREKALRREIDREASSSFYQNWRYKERI